MFTDGWQHPNERTFTQQKKPSLGGDYDNEEGEEEEAISFLDESDKMTPRFEPKH